MRLEFFYCPRRVFGPEAKTRGGIIAAPAHICEERNINKNKYVFIYLEPNQKFSDYPVPPRAPRNYPRSPCAPAFKSLSSCSSCKGCPHRRNTFKFWIQFWKFASEGEYSSFERFFCLSTVIAQLGSTVSNQKPLDANTENKKKTYKLESFICKQISKISPSIHNSKDHCPSTVFVCKQISKISACIHNSKDHCIQFCHSWLIYGSCDHVTK